MIPNLRVPSAGGAVAKRSHVPPVAKPRSTFDLSFGHKTTMDTGYLVPLLMKEVLPGDTWNVRMTAFARLLTLVNPIMDNIFFETHFFFVPWRLVWDNTEKFFGEQANPGDSIAYTIPKSTSLLFTDAKSLIDYFGINPVITGTHVVNVLPFRAYRKIWNDWYRDENLQNSATYSTGDGPEALTSLKDVLKRGKRGDYFTLALPWPQKQVASVSFLPDNVPVVSNGLAPTFRDLAGTNYSGRTLNSVAASNAVNFSGAAIGGAFAARFDSVTGLETDFASNALATINAFRQAYAIQVYLEMNARGGTRYPEYLHAHWGVTSSDARLQRAEFLGGGRTPVNVSAVAQTSATDPTLTPQGNLSGVGTAAAQGHGFVKSFEEHGFVFCIASFRSDMSYQYGAERVWFRSTLYDVADPAFANLGEQAVLQREIWYDGTAGDSTVFGYQERYAEYKQSYNMITGNMRSQSPDSFDLWHVAQEYGVAPVLNSTFIVEPDANVDRVIAVPDVDQWLVDAYFKCIVARCLPVFGVPGLAGRF